jgi:hypothetical protein
MSTTGLRGYSPSQPPTLHSHGTPQPSIYVYASGYRMHPSPAVLAVREGRLVAVLDPAVQVLELEDTAGTAGAVPRLLASAYARSEDQARPFVTPRSGFRQLPSRPEEGPAARGRRREMARRTSTDRQSRVGASDLGQRLP